MSPEQIFSLEVKENISGLSRDQDIQNLSRIWTRDVAKHKWSYNFRWLGRPAIQFPNDAWAMQEIIWQVKPDLIIESGIAHGGSLIFYASLLALLDLCDAVNAGIPFDPMQSRRKVVGLDIDIRAHNRSAIESHPFSNWIRMIEGSSVAKETIEQVHQYSLNHSCVLLSLDSNHTHNHVLAELNAYASLVTPGSYCVVFDTIVDDMPEELSANRPWGPGNNPKTAVKEFLSEHSEFIIDTDIHNKLLITVAPDGYLRRIT